MAASRNRQALLQAQETYCTAYVNALASILEAVYVKNRADESIKELRAKFALGRNQPLVILQKSGPLIWKYRAEIEAGDSVRIVNMNYDEEINARVTDTSQVDYVKSIVGKLRLTWEAFNVQEKAAIVTYLQRMLSNLASHAAGERQLERLKEEQAARRQN